MTRTFRLVAASLLGLALALTTVACGSENEATSAESSPSSFAKAPGSAESSVPVVGGPKPQSRASSTAPTSESTTDAGQKTCGATGGPDGALQIHVVSGDLDCDTARTIAKEYGPLIATGEPQSVSGWECGPSEESGEMSRCTRGGQAFALMI
ncbi:hypothetical protein [Gordonia shandongensis]|uniref:hypothetical protein n=1 Tax=Gordonia shandongensis TaxID=376351 RepID=UPI0003FC04D1|nr:hypothetical protein [Gordonia shandongensis]